MRLRIILSLLALALSPILAAAQNHPTGGITPDQLAASFLRGDPGQDPSGDLSLRIPILTVPGRAGLDYPLFLTYQSDQPRDAVSGPVGLGFGLQIGSVGRSIHYRKNEQDLSSFGTNKT